MCLYGLAEFGDELRGGCGTGDARGDAHCGGGDLWRVYDEAGEGELGAV